jgi:uncharacterized protein YgbK (DUF1537 family)
VIERPGQLAVRDNRVVLALIADDLTGASDAAVQFARRGLATRVLFDLTAPCQAEGVEALAVDTDSRALPGDEAGARVRRIAGHVAAARPRHVFKKIDSTLRGNLGDELDAVLDVFGFRLAVVAPAFPALGRTTHAGVHYLRGSPVHLTEIGHDPHAPVHESNLLRRLAEGSRRTPGLVPLELVERGSAAIRDRADALLRQDVSLLVCDAQRDADLCAIAAAFAGRRDLVWVGSAGLAEVLPPALGLPCRVPRSAGSETADGPVLIVAGSLSEVTRRQVAALEASGCAVTVELDPGAIVGPAAAHEPELARARSALGVALRAGDALLTVGSDRALVPDAEAGAVAARIADVLGAVAAESTRAYAVAGLVLTGGETARSVCRQLGVTGVELLAEVEPGVPLGRLVGAEVPSLPTVTKAGAFGSDQTLVRALHYLKGDR